MATINHFRSLESWKLSRIISKEIFEIIVNTESFRKDYALRDQMRRSSGSIMDNIAEGFGRGNNKEFILFLGYSLGSCSEFVSQLYRAEDSGYLSSLQRDKLEKETERTEALIRGLLDYLKKTTIRGKRYKVEESSQGYFTKNILPFEDLIHY